MSGANKRAGMNDFTAAFHTAFTLIGSFDAELRGIVLLSLAVSLTASACAFAIGAPLGTALAVYQFHGRGALIVIVNALLGLPPVVVGLAVYLLLSRSGPLGSFGLLFTPSAMVVAQTILVTRIIAALTRQTVEDLWAEYRDEFNAMNVGPLTRVLTLIWEGRFSLV